MKARLQRVRFDVVDAPCSNMPCMCMRTHARRRQQQAQQARWEREQAELRRGLANADGPASAAPVVMESFTLGWFNMLVQSTWAPVLERLVSNIAAERLQLVLNEVGAQQFDRLTATLSGALAQPATLGVKEAVNCERLAVAAAGV